ncbi:MAG: helix-turn-helix domain-containing protein [Opitutales bacterium]
MEPITAESLRAWRRKQGITQAELATHLGLKKVAVTKIESGRRQISPPEQKLLQLLVHGRYPFSSPELDARGTRLEFSAEEWRIIHRAAAREGYDDAKRWIVDKIRSYLRMNPDSAPELLAAEERSPYNPRPDRP